MANNTISLSARNFIEYKQELLKYVNDYYPDLNQNFIDNSIGQLLLELNAGVADSLNFYIDKQVNENFIDFAQDRRNLLQLAKNNAVKIPNRASSITVCDFTVDVPVNGDTLNSSYLPIIKAGSQVVGSGSVFELNEDLDFSSAFSLNGIPNRRYVPILDSNNNVVRYEVTKREVLVSGRSKQYSTVIRTSKDFFSIILPEKDIISIEQIIVYPGINNPLTLPNSAFFSTDFRWYEVDYLAQSEVFLPRGDRNVNGTYNGKWINVPRRFIKEFTPRGFCKITFGNGDNIANDFANVLQNDNFTYNVIQGLIKNNSLGERLPSNSTVYIRYKVGGGTNSNVAPNTLTKLGFSDIVVNGRREDINEQVRRSTRVTNPIPGLGGKNIISNEEIRYLTKFNLAAQNRAVTLNDYVVKISNMDGKFGKPFKVKAYKEDNKVILGILGLTSNGKLNNRSTDILKTNIVEYLSRFKMINDFVEVKDNEVINLGFDVEILVDENIQTNEVMQNVSNVIRDYFDITTRDIGEEIFLGELNKDIYLIDGVLNIVSLKVYNVVDQTGIKYSPTQTSMGYQDETIDITASLYRRQINVLNNTLFVNNNQMFEIRYPENDIKIIAKTLI